jgi:Fic family protein
MINPANDIMSYHIFNTEQQIKAEFILKNQYAQLFDLQSFELKELAIAWCYYSGKIEGNTYSYVETESLLKDDITSPKRYEDAKMLKNLYLAFTSELRYIQQGNTEIINESMLFRLHNTLMSDLISDEEKGTLRNKAVAITGTNYKPPKDKYEIQLQLRNILVEQDSYTHPLEKAVFLHCNIARLQPFIDGNKRLSRLTESIVMMNNRLIPVYSTQETDILNYRKGLMQFYETQDYNLYIDYFLNRQIQRINELSLKTDISFDLKNIAEIKPGNKAGQRKLKM